MRLNLLIETSKDHLQKAQMKCMLYLRLNRVTRSSSRIHEVVFEFKSNCKKTRIFKIFGNYSMDYNDEVMRNLKVQFLEIAFDVYFGKGGTGSNTENQSVQNGSLVKGKNICTPPTIIRNQSIEFKPEDLFYNLTYYQNQTEFSNFTQIDQKVKLCIPNQTNSNGLNGFR